jgi:hypothetical protein
MATKFTKWSQRYTYVKYFNSKAFQNMYTEIGGFGLKVNHLATLTYSLF